MEALTVTNLRNLRFVGFVVFLTLLFIPPFLQSAEDLIINSTLNYSMVEQLVKAGTLRITARVRRAPERGVEVVEVYYENVTKIRELNRTIQELKRKLEELLNFTAPWITPTNCSVIIINATCQPCEEPWILPEECVLNVINKTFEIRNITIINVTNVTCPECPACICPNVTFPNITCPEVVCPECPSYNLTCPEPNITLECPECHHAYAQSVSSQT